MNTPAPAPCSAAQAACPAEPPLAVPAHVARHLAMLQELAEIGMRMARRAEHPVQADPARPEPAPTPEQGLVFTRIARAVRQTIALEKKLRDDLANQGRTDVADRARRLAIAQRQRAVRQRTQLRGLLERAIDADPNVQDREYLLLDLDERLQDEHIYAPLTPAELGQRLHAICEDLGITPDFKNWTDEMLGMDDDPPAATAPCVPPH